MSLKQSQFALEVEQLRKVVQENADIADEVSTNLDNVEQELGHIEGLTQQELTGEMFFFLD